jgi:hypothetical protein
MLVHRHRFATHTRGGLTMKNAKSVIGIVALFGVVSCGVDEGPAPVGVQSSALTTTTLYAVRPNRSVSSVRMTGSPFSATADLYKDVADPSPDFDASFINGTSGLQSSVDFAYAAPAHDGPVSAVNVLYFARNSLCTAALLCGMVHSELLQGTTVVAVSASHQLPNIEQGWFMYSDSFAVSPGQISSVAQLRTRVVLTHFAPYSTQPQRVSTVAANITYSF